MGRLAEPREGRQRMFANEKVLLVDGIMIEPSWKGKHKEKLLGKCQCSDYNVFSFYIKRWLRAVSLL